MIRYGTYGPVGRKRQLWRCTPPDGERHSFAGNLVRTVLEEPGFCGSCEQPLLAHQGPTAASMYRYPVNEIALALHRVGRGMTYSEAARRARVRTSRGGHVSPQLVGNWIEVFAPVVTAALAETSWPETVILDAKPFSANTIGGGRGIVFTVLAAVGYDKGATKGRVLGLHAVPGSASIVKWGRFLQSLPGEPVLVVSDDDDAIHGAVEKTWPNATIRLCRYHLKKNLSGRLKPVMGNSGRLRIDRLHVDALDTPQGWAELKRVLPSFGDEALTKFITNNEKRLDAEFSAPGPLPDHWGNGAVEQALQIVKARVGQRAFCLRNAERTNRWLELVRANLNRQDDVHAYAAAIRAHLDTPGRARLPKQLTVKDHLGLPSLR